MQHERAVWQGLQKEVTTGAKHFQQPLKAIKLSQTNPSPQVTFLQSRASKRSEMLILFLQFFINLSFGRLTNTKKQTNPNSNPQQIPTD